MQNPRDILTPDSIELMDSIARAGSFAAAAKQRNLVPSALTYRVRQIEDALDVLLFDRSSRNAKLTAAGQELLREGVRILAELDTLAHRVKRVATGWEPQLTIAVDNIISATTVMDLCEAFFAQFKGKTPPTRLKIRDEVLSGTLAALTTGQADLALGVAPEAASTSGILYKPLDSETFIFAVAPHHPLAKAKEPISDVILQQHRAVAVADTVQRGAGLSYGLLGGQDVFTVPTMNAKLNTQLRGLGVGFLPASMAKPHINAGRLIHKEVARSQRVVRFGYAWRVAPHNNQGLALQWWLAQLEGSKTKTALLHRH